MSNIQLQEMNRKNNDSNDDDGNGGGGDCGDIINDNDQQQQQQPSEPTNQTLPPIKLQKKKPPPLSIIDNNKISKSNNSTTNNNNNNNSSMDDPKTPNTPGPLSAESRLRKQMEKERKIGHRRVDDEGQVTYKKFPTTQIMGSIQLGIGHAVGSLASKPERDLLMKDFMEIELVQFNKEGSQTTPAHHYSDFKFKVYAPIAFRYFRDLFGIQPDDYLLSLCNEPLRELSNPGASGSVFYLTHDDNFIIKTVQHKEAEFLLKLLPGYYMNLNQNPRTLLPKFFGQYCYICGGKNVRFVVMNNLLPSFVKMHQKYDLKGSTYKRKANKYERQKQSPTYKDLDFMEHHPDGIYLENDTYHALIKTMQRDCRVLESFKIMDYSLLVGVHNLDQSQKEKEEKYRQQQEQNILNELNGGNNPENDTRQQQSNNANNNKYNQQQQQRFAAFSTALESIQAEIDPIDAEDDIPPGGIPARNSKGERLLLYVGIIDILQSYRLRKKLEHTWKSVLHDGDSISVHRPGFYAKRFHDFMSKKVFRKIPSLDLPEIKGPHRKFRNLVSSYIGLALNKQSRKRSLISSSNIITNTNNHLNAPTTTTISSTVSSSIPPTTLILTNTTNNKNKNNNDNDEIIGLTQPKLSSNVQQSSSSTAAASTAPQSTNPSKQPISVQNHSFIPHGTTTTVGFATSTATHPQFPSMDSTKCLKTAVVIKQTYNKHQSIIQNVNQQKQKLLEQQQQLNDTNSTNNDQQQQCNESTIGSSVGTMSSSITSSSCGSGSSNYSNFSNRNSPSIGGGGGGGSSSSTASSIRNVATIQWTPPHSVGSITPSHTEGTPSLTESSDSEYYPSTPLRKIRSKMINSNDAKSNNNDDLSLKKIDLKFNKMAINDINDDGDDNDDEVVCTIIQQQQQP